MKSINVKNLCCGQIQCSAHLPVHWPHSRAGGQDVEAAQLDGWSKDEAALITTTHHIACILVVQEYLNIFPQASKSYERCEYFLLYNNCVVRSRENVLKLRHFIELHYVGIAHLLWRAWFHQLLYHNRMTFCTLFANQMTVEGQRLFLKLIHNTMLPIPTLSVWDKSWMYSELNLTGRQGCQVADSNLNMSVVSRFWRPVLHLDNQMMHAVEESKSSTASACPSSWYIKAILSSRWCHGCAENAKAPGPFIKHIEWMMVGYKEGRMVFDCYLEQ